MELLKRLKQKAKKDPKRIVFPESYDPRILRACEIIKQSKIAKPILISSNKIIQAKCKKAKLECVDPREVRKKYTNLLQKTRKITKKKAIKLLKTELYLGTLMVKAGHADGMIAGARNTTADTLRPAFEIIGTTEEAHHACGIFLIQLEKKNYLFADCAVNIKPTPKELAEIAIDAAEIAKKFKIKPKIGMLSFSTKGSAKHPLVDHVIKATKIAKRRQPKLIIEGELQVDAALDPFTCKIKAPKSKLKGNANVLIFPDLQSANIAYKLVQRLAHAKAVGPIIQGLKKPINDLSRGCSVQDIVDLTAITVVEAQK